MTRSISQGASQCPGRIGLAIRSQSLASPTVLSRTACESRQEREGAGSVPVLSDQGKHFPARAEFQSRLLDFIAGPAHVVSSPTMAYPFRDPVDVVRRRKRRPGRCRRAMAVPEEQRPRSYRVRHSQPQRSKWACRTTTPRENRSRESGRTAAAPGETERKALSHHDSPGCANADRAAARDRPTSAA